MIWWWHLFWLWWVLVSWWENSLKRSPHLFTPPISVSSVFNTCHSMYPITCLSWFIDVQSPCLLIHLLLLEPFLTCLWKSCDLGNEILCNREGEVSYLSLLVIKGIYKLFCHFHMIPRKFMKKRDPRGLLKDFKTLWFFISINQSLWFNPDCHVYEMYPLFLQKEMKRFFFLNFNFSNLFL